MSDPDPTSPGPQPPPAEAGPGSATPEEIGAAVGAALRMVRQGPGPAADGPPPPALETPLALAERAGELPVRVMLRPIASSLPFGFFALVTAATMLGLQALGFLPTSATLAVGLVLLPTSLIQLVAGISAVLGRDVIAASLLMTFSGVWLGTALVYILHPAHGLEVLAFWYLALAPVIAALISSGTSKLALAFVPMIGLPTFLVSGIWLLIGGHRLAEVVGALSFALALVALYAALALLFEDSRRRTVLPTLRRGPMKRALTGDFDSQLESLEHEAGVRRYL